MYRQYCIAPRYDLFAIYLEAAHLTIYICPLCLYDLYHLPL